MAAPTLSPAPRGVDPSHPKQQRRGRQLQWTAVAASGLISVLYGLIFLGVLSVGRAEAGDLGVLGAAGVVFVVLAALLWWFRNRLLWVAAGLLQLALGAMYVAVAPVRNPAYEVWGLTIRALSLVLLVAVVSLLLGSRRRTA